MCTYSSLTLLVENVGHILQAKHEPYSSSRNIIRRGQISDTVYHSQLRICIEFLKQLRNGRLPVICPTPLTTNRFRAQLACSTTPVLNVLRHVVWFLVQSIRIKWAASPRSLVDKNIEL